ncbi:hypothetical protein L0666_06545 [Octadecabacter sp. CECT 8868]|uniref:hypothetical protein n=1 Tax=Octadecabacter algicola TaxID=2909342 RepID=UPI001F2D82D6|nr:hypothetical protein [Octadecabacter algicola]MCF2904638.1 hypothetical protein [Octadecabacter algicola]
MTTTTENSVLNNDVAIKAISDLTKLQKRFKSADALLTRANNAVYDVLSNAFAVLVELKTAEEPKPVRELFDYKLSEMTRSSKAKHATQATSLELKVIRFVCGNLNNKRESTYARVLRIAFAEDLHTNTDLSFVDWIIGAGGIDAVRRSGNGQVPVDYIARARAELKFTDQLAPVASAHIASMGAAEPDAEYCVAVVRKNADGTFGIVTTVDNAALTKQALARVGKALDVQDSKERADELERKQKEDAANATKLISESANIDLEAA